MKNPRRHDFLSRLLIVEPDFAQLRPVLDALRQEDFKVTVCSTVETVLAHVQRLDFGVAILDLQPTQAADAEWLAEFERVNPQVHVVLRIAGASRVETQAAIRLGAFAVVDRDEPLTALVDQVHRAFRDHYRRIAWQEMESPAAPREIVATDSWNRGLHRRTG